MGIPIFDKQLRLYELARDLLQCYIDTYIELGSQELDTEHILSCHLRYVEIAAELEADYGGTQGFAIAGFMGDSGVQLTATLEALRPERGAQKGRCGYGG